MPPAPEPTEAGRQPAVGDQPVRAFVALAGLATATATALAGSPGGQPGLQALGARPKLVVGGADDQAEIEADAMAETALRRLPHDGVPGIDYQPPGVVGPLRRAAASAPAPAVRRAAAAGAAGGEVDSQTEQALQAARSSGAPLATAVRREYEAAFGADFSSVRVHSGPASARLNSALGAHAFTLGSDIYFGDRAPNTDAPADRRLMAHELAHTLQDDGDARRAMVRRLAVQITPAWQQLEDEEMTEEVGLTSAEARPNTEALPDGHAGGSDETMTPELTVTGAQATKAWNLVIESVAIVGRPTTLFTGSMGDHMTAFVISRKGVENALFGQPFAVAVHELDEMVADLEKLPGWDLVDSLKPVEDEEARETATELASLETADIEGESIGSASPSSAPVLAAVPDLDVEEAPARTEPYRRASHHARFREAEQNLITRRALVGTAATDDVKVLRLQDYVAAYLELRELVPLSASNWLGANRGKGGKGDGETGLEGFLAEPGTQRPGNLRRDFLSTIATYRMAQAAIEPNKDALAILMPGLDHALSADERTELMARQHVQSVLSNFPQNFAGLADDILRAEGREPIGRDAGKSSASSAEAERDPDADFTTILNHLTRIVRMRYSEAAEKEFAHQMQTAKVLEGTEEGEAAVRDAMALTAHMKTPEPTRMKASALTEEEKASGRVPKRERGGPETVEDADDLYEGLTPGQAKKVYTGRDGFTKRKSDPPSPLPKSDLAVQILLDDAGVILRAVVGRQGRYTKGAHTIPWMQWVLWLNADIIGKQPPAALVAFNTTTAPAVRAKLAGDTVVTTAPSETMTLEIEEAGPQGGEADQPVGSMPLIELQVAIADLLDEITDAADSSVLDATDTGGKGEAHHRVALAAYEKGQRTLTPEQLVIHILALCDVGEANSKLAKRTVNKTLAGAEQDYPNAYAASLISEYELEDLVDRASIGKEGVYEQHSEASSESESDSEEEKRSKKRKKKAHKGK